MNQFRIKRLLKSTNRNMALTSFQIGCDTCQSSRSRVCAQINEDAKKTHTHIYNYRALWILYERKRIAGLKWLNFINSCGWLSVFAHFQQSVSFFLVCLLHQMMWKNDLYHIYACRAVSKIKFSWTYHITV